MYADTSRDVVDRADVRDAEGVVDLCCGTGATTRVLLDRIPARAEVWAVDGSAAMIGVAQAETADPRVHWIHSAAEDVDHCRPEAAPPVDAVVCNSAIWQTDLPTTFAAVRRVLRADGRFAFNIGGRFIRLPDHEQSAPPPGTGRLAELMQQAAIEELGYRPQPRVRRRDPLSPESVRDALALAGFRQHSAEVITYGDPPDLVRAWLEVPIFADTVCPGLPYEQQRRALELAVQRTIPGPPTVARWYLVVATAID
jgi:SAM-dependent methyltransferase